MPVTEQHLVAEFARSWNALEPERIIAHLADDAVYESQSVREPLRGREAIATYLRGKMATIREHPEAAVRAELGYVGDQVGQRVSVGFPGQTTGHPCVLVTQGTSSEPEALVLLTVENEQIRRIDLCTVAPHPTNAVRTGIYPGIERGSGSADRDHHA